MLGGEGYARIIVVIEVSMVVMCEVRRHYEVSKHELGGQGYARKAIEVNWHLD